MEYSIKDIARIIGSKSSVDSEDKISLSVDRQPPTLRTEQTLCHQDKDQRRTSLHQELSITYAIRSQRTFSGV